MKARKSLISNEYKCYFCKETEKLELHHIYHGTANRRVSDMYGCVVYLCNEHHTGTDGVHGKNGHDRDMQLKIECQKRWEQEYGSRQTFIKTFGRSYI